MKRKPKEIMKPGHPAWEEFCSILEGPDRCNFHLADPDDESSIRWTCAGGHDKTFARKVLNAMNAAGANIDVGESLQYFDDHGGHCDCEILFNVDR